MARSIQKLTENRATVAAPLLTITAIALFFTAPASIIAAGPGSLDTGMVVVFWTPFSLVAAILAGIVAFFPPGNPAAASPALSTGAVCFPGRRATVKGRASTH